MNWFRIVYNGMVLVSLGVGRGSKTSHRQNAACYEMLHRASDKAGSCKHGNEPSGLEKAQNFLTSWVTIIFSRRTVLREDSSND
jgi:hypothetical protein